MSKIEGFSAIADQYAEILILGSMPSVTSLDQHEYYAHERNAFWPIMLTLFCNGSTNDSNDYNQRTELLKKNKIAVWDVLQSCNREGSLDTAIKQESIQVNDFYTFFSTHSSITKIFFNGAMAEKVYYKTVLPKLQNHFQYIKYCRLPSTSPAHASMSLQQKTEHWKKQIKNPSN